jgi:hypothetical protein
MNLAKGLETPRRVSVYYLIILRICVAAFCAVLIPVGSYAQTTVFPEWVARYAGPSPYHLAGPNAIAADSQGNSYVTGLVEVGTASGPSQEISTMKYDSDGHKLWQALVASPVGTAQGRDIVVDATGNVYVTGDVMLHGTFSHPTDDEIVTMKYDTNGVRQWIDSVAPPPGGTNIPIKLLVGPQGEVIVSGTSYLPSPQGSQVLTIKYDSSGRQQWIRRDPSSTTATNTAAGMGIDSQENIYVAANSSHTQPVIYKYDVNGNLLKSFSFGFDPAIRAFYVDQQGNSYAGGCIPGPLITKFDSQGTRDWVHNLSPYSCLSSIRTDTSGNVFLSQTLRENSGNSSDISVLKLNASGVQQWQAHSNGQANGSGKDFAGPLVVNSQGDAYVTGDETISLNTQTNIITIKYGPDGQQIWMQQYSKPQQVNLERGIAIGGDGGLFVTGTSSNVVNGSIDWLTIDYVQDAAKLAPTSLPFGNQAVNTESAAQTVQLTNATSAALDITGIAISGDFHETNNCPSRLAAELSCTISVTFKPSTLGSRAGTLTVSDTWEGSPQRVTLAGTGTTQ